MKMSNKCRIWWPNHLSSIETASSVFLFGWFVSSSSASLDIVVAFACSEATLLSIQSSIQGILKEISGQMPVSLQDKCVLSLLGYCAVDLSGKCRLSSEGNQIISNHGNLFTHSSQDMLGEKATWWSCEFCKHDGLFDFCKLVSDERSNWVHLLYKYHGSVDRKFKVIPTLHHMHRNGLTVSHVDLHVILYETPLFGSHHFSLECWRCQQVKILKKPRWVEALHQKQLFLDLDTVVLGINCAHAAKIYFGRHVGPKRFDQFPIVFMCVTLTWRLLALFIASLSTLFYMIFQVFHVVLSSGSESLMYLTLEKLFNNSWNNIHMRCCQILYWPVLLKDNSLRSQSCVEYAEKSAIRRHSMWSSIVTDVLLGNILGLPLYFHAESASVRVLELIDDITNNLLRSGCVWLMGVPAGFKLNTELAGVLGMISLNAIQIWSTLWFFVGSFFISFVKALAVSGIIFGLTTSAALIMDMISIATSHVATLHWFISSLYSLQIQAITALWRLFRGRKWNPLRHRYDSYDYSVEQHIVGSLLFTPLLLVLPTTSVFYIFITIMKSTICFICITIEVIISSIHATPFLKILLWLMRPRRFPSGIWFDIRSYQSSSCNSLDSRDPTDACMLYPLTRQSMVASGSQSSNLILFLRSNCVNLRELVSPHFKRAFSGVSSSFVASAGYGILVGKSIPSSLGSGVPLTFPWMSIPCTEYWHICHDSVLACQKDRLRNVFQ